MKVLLIEDDYFSAKHLEKLIMNIDSSIEIHGPLRSVSEVVGELSEHNDYDIVFSDIRLVDGDVFEAFRQIMPQFPVIFTTAYDEYAMAAIKSNGLDYIMKPVDLGELRAALEKMERLRGSMDGKERLEVAVMNARSYRERILVSAGDELKVLSVDDINYISTDGKSVTAFTDNGGAYILSMTMGELESELNPDKFFRINRQYISSLWGIVKINVLFGGKLKVKIKCCPDDSIVVSKDRSALLKKWLNR